MTNETTNNEWIEKARKINFDALEANVGERIGALRLYVENIDKISDDPAYHDAICRDLIFPCIKLLAQFCVSVKISG